MDGLVGQRRYNCFKCGNNVSLHDDILSKYYRCNGRAFSFKHAMNVKLGTEEDRLFITGHYTVVDVHCAHCLDVLGWKYIRANEPSQKYKEGLFVLEKSKIVKDNW